MLLAKSAERSDIIYRKYANLCKHYCDLPCTDDQIFDATLVDKFIRWSEDSKAADLHSVSAENLKHCHPAIVNVLAKLFNIMLIFGSLPSHSVAVTWYLYRRTAMQSKISDSGELSGYIYQSCTVKNI